MSESNHNVNYQCYRQRVSGLSLSQIPSVLLKLCKNATSNKIVSYWYKYRTIQSTVFVKILSGFCKKVRPKSESLRNAIGRGATIGLNKLNTFYA